MNLDYELIKNKSGGYDIEIPKGMYFSWAETEEAAMSEVHSYYNVRTDSAENMRDDSSGVLEFNSPSMGKFDFDLHESQTLHIMESMTASMNGGKSAKLKAGDIVSVIDGVVCVNKEKRD